MIPLPAVAAKAAQALCNLGPFDTLTHHRQAQVVSHLNDGSNDRAAVAVHGVDEGSIDLDFRHRHVAQVAERRVATAKVINRDAEAGAAQCREHVARPQVNNVALRDLECDLARRNAVAVEQLAQFLDETGLGQVARRKVDVEVHGKALLPPARRLGQGLSQHPSRQWVDDVVLLGGVDELARRHDSAQGMTPSH